MYNDFGPNPTSSCITKSRGVSEFFDLSSHNDTLATILKALGGPLYFDSSQQKEKHLLLHFIPSSGRFVTIYLIKLKLWSLMPQNCILIKGGIQKSLAYTQ